jgi:hypothetical protein
MIENELLSPLLLPLPKHKISDQEWCAIVEASGLPDHARALVEEAIALYRLAEKIGQSGSSHQVRQLLRDTADSASKLQQQLLSIRRNRSASHVLARSLNDSSDLLNAQRDLKKELTSAAGDLSILSDRLEGSAKLVAPAKRGAHLKSLPIALSVARLSNIWELIKGVPITRSRKGTINARNFIEATLRIANPNIATFSVDEAMKRLIKTKEITKKLGC